MGIFFITDFIILLIIDLLRFLIFLLSFGSYVFLKVCLFYLSNLICWHITAHSIQYDHFYFCNFDGKIPSFIPDLVIWIIDLSLSFFYQSNQFVNFVDIFKEFTFSFTDFSRLYPIYFFIFWSLLFLFFSLLVFFSSFIGGRIVIYFIA